MSSVLIAGVIQIPRGLDTSRPLRLFLRWKPSNNNAGDIEFQTFVSRAQVGDTVDGGLTETTASYVVSVSSQQDELQETFFEIDVSDLTPDDVLAIVYRRDATTGNLTDTYSGNVEIVQTGIFGYFWS